jgi:hypothetical protein
LRFSGHAPKAELDSRLALWPDCSVFGATFSCQTWLGRNRPQNGHYEIQLAYLTWTSRTRRDTPQKPTPTE